VGVSLTASLCAGLVTPLERVTYIVIEPSDFTSERPKNEIFDDELFYAAFAEQACLGE